MLIFGLCSTSDDWPSNPRDKSHPKCKKMATKSSKNEKLFVRLHSTSDHWLSNPSDKSCLRSKNMATKLSKNEMLIFRLHSTSDDRSSNPSHKSHPKCKKKKKWLPNHQKMKCSFLDYVQLLMIS